LLLPFRTGKIFYRSLKAGASLAGLTVLLTCLPANAENAPTNGKGPLDGELLQMRTLENPPLAYTDENGDITGILVDGIREAVRRTGHEVEFRIEPWKRVLQEVAVGNADAAFNAGRTEERQTWGLYHNSVLIDETYVFFAREPKALSRDLVEAPELRVGIQLGYYYGERFDRLLQDQPFRALEVSQTIPRNLKLLTADRTDVFIGDLLPTIHYLKELGLENEIHVVRGKESGLPLVVSTSPTFVAFSRRRIDPTYVQAFDEALESMKADGTYNAILDNYQLNLPELPETP
jgi:polar amino acid transport system substrate-binding protein